MVSANEGSSAVGRSRYPDTVLMVRPACFYGNAETAGSNSFQRQVSHAPEALLKAALVEFDNSVKRLEACGLNVLVWEADPAADAPDALFPNNWFSTHADGRVMIYPMATANRRRERRVPELVDVLSRHGFAVRRLVDWSSREDREQYLEGTGSLILDRRLQRVFAARSVRTHPDCVMDWANEFGYEPILFDAFDPRGNPIYHTNVLMAVGNGVAVLGGPLVQETDRERVRSTLAMQREVIELSSNQIDAFAGNVLFLAAPDPCVVLSVTAWSSLSSTQRQQLERHAQPVICEVPTIERVGGGGIRCMLAEICLPRQMG